MDAAENLLNSQSLNQITDRLPDLLNGFGESELETTLPLYVYKVDGRWIPDPFSLMSRFGISFSSVLGMLEY